MKRALYLLITFTLTFSAGAGFNVVYGQLVASTPNQNQAKPSSLQFGNSRLDSVECGFLQTNLNLSATQTTAVLQAIAARDKQLQALNAQSLSVVQRAGQLKPIVNGYSNQLQQILTTAQQQQWAILVQNKLDSTISRCKANHLSYTTLNQR